MPKKAGKVFQIKEPVKKQRGGADRPPILGLPPVWGFSFPRWELALNAVAEQPGAGGQVCGAD